MIVIDSSALIEVLLRSPRAAEIEERIFAPHETLHAPHLLDLEVAQVLRRYCISGEMTPLRGSEAIADLLNLPIARYPHDIFLDRIWELRNTLTAYDAAFVALAESLPAALLTCDAKLAATHGHSASVVLIQAERSAL
jgi:predicted nucleic acid-binding protein